MKNLFELNEEEKNRILGLHESATKNHYLISEQNSQSVVDKIKDSSLWTKYFGGNWKFVSGTDQDVLVSIDVVEYVDIKVGIKISHDGNSGSFSFTYPNVTFSDSTSDVKSRTGGTWSFKDGIFTGTIDGQTFYKQTIQEGIYSLLKAFYPMSMQHYVRKSDLGTPPQNTSSGNMGGSTWEQVVTKFPCLANEKDKNIYSNGSYDYVKAKLDGVNFLVFIGDGHIYNPTEGKFTGIYLGKNYPCNPVVMTDPEVKKTGEIIPPKPKYYQEIVNLQSKVGLENTGKLDQATLKAIMDKLSQKV